MGKRVKSPRTERIALVVREDERSRLIREAQVLGVSVSELVRQRVFAAPAVTTWARCYSPPSSFRRSSAAEANCQTCIPGGRSS